MNRFLSLLLLLACSLVAQAASPSYNTSTGVVSPTQFLKLDAAELKVMGVNVLTTAPTIYTSNGTLTGDRTVNGGGNSLTFTNLDLLAIDVIPTGDFLAAFKNTTTNRFRVTKWGGLWQMPDDLQDDYGDPVSSDTLITFNAYDLSGIGASKIYGEVINNPTDWDQGAGYTLDATYGESPLARLILSSYHPTNATSWTLISGVVNQFSEFTFTYDSVQRLAFLPSTTASLTPYFFDTTRPHTSGNLVEVKNNGTNVFTVDYLGNLTANNINIPGDQTANNLTITNELVVRGSIKANTLIVTNTVNFYENTYVSNFFATATTVSNNLTVLGDYIGTIDPTVSGTVLKVQKSVKLQFPRRVDGAGCTYSNTNDYTLTTFMLPTFSGTAATNVNLCEFGFRVPGDLDTSKDLTASLTIRLTDVDTAAHTYNVGMISIANSSTASGTPANYVPLTVAADGSGGSGDIESVNNVTLTDWRSNMTAGQWCLLRLNRDGDDDSTIASNMMELEIFYWATQ